MVQWLGLSAFTGRERKGKEEKEKEGRKERRKKEEGRKRKKGKKRFLHNDPKAN